jgi:glucose/arabinose dehydrogenase
VLLRIFTPRQFALLAGVGLLLCLALPGLNPRATRAQLPDTAGQDINFQQDTLNFTISSPASLAFGPDGRLYVAGASSISALTLDPVTKNVLATEQIASDLDLVLGLAFDPATPSPVKLYASRQNLDATQGYSGVVSTFTAPGWQRQDVITRLPSSVPHNNHMTNGLAFGPDGRLYIAQGSNADSGIADPPGGQLFFNETPLSAAILVADVHAQGFNGTITYDQQGSPVNDTVNQTGGDVHVFAPGTRNPYDLVWHSNSHLYATDNGAMGKGTSLGCASEGGFTSTSDELNLIEEGNYYGAPNRNRGRFDERQCIYHSPQAGSGADFTAPIAILPTHCSCDGIAEYTAGAFGGALQGDLIYAAWGRDFVGRMHLAANGRSVTTTSVLSSNFSSPLDVVVGPDGTIYVAEFAANQISYLTPDSDGDGCADARELGPDRALGGQRDPDNPYDFYDVNGDGRVTMSDVTAVIQAFGPASGPNYRTAKDRSPPPPGGQWWEMGPPDGVINLLDDVAGVINQFGHSCTTGL